jgi:hypothetical protein
VAGTQIQGLTSNKELEPAFGTAPGVRVLGATSAH